MAVVGEVSAILSIVEIGFSLAKAIRTTVQDYQDARSDIVSLADDIETTLALVSDLNTLILNNNTTRVFNNNGLRIAKTCLRVAEQIVKELVELLTSVGVPEDKRSKIKSEDITVSRFERLGWLRVKRRVKLKREELNKVRLEILVAKSCKDVQEATTPGQIAALSTIIAGLERRRRKAEVRLANLQAANKRGNSPARSSGSSILRYSRISLPHSKASPRAVSERSLKSQDRGSELSGIPTRNIGAPATSRPSFGHQLNGGGDVDGSNVVLLASASGVPHLSTPTVEPSSHGGDALKIQADSQHHRDHDAAVEAFKQQKRNELLALTEACARTQNRIFQTTNGKLEDKEIRKLVEEQHAEQLASVFDQWLPGLQIRMSSVPLPDLDSNAEARSHGSNKDMPPLRSNSSTKENRSLPADIETSNSSPRNSRTLRYAHLLVIERNGDQPLITSLTPPSRLRLHSFSKTTRVWAEMREQTQRAIMWYLDSEMGLPGVHRWHLSAVRLSGSSKLWQQVIRLPETERSDSSVDRKCYTVLFAAGDAYGPRTSRASSYTTSQRNEQASTKKLDQQSHVVGITDSSQYDTHIRSEMPQTANISPNQRDDTADSVEIVDIDDTSADPFDLLPSKANASGKKANNQEAKEGQKGKKAAKPSAPTFEGYTFTILDDTDERSLAWMRTRKVQMPFTSDEIYKQAVTAQGKSGVSASNQFSELEHTQQLIISRLLAEKNDSKKRSDAPWHLFNVEKLHKKSKRRFRTIRIENAIRVTIVHKGEQRDAGLRASDAMGSTPFDEEILDLAEPRKAKKNKTKANKAGKKKVTKAAASTSDQAFQGWDVFEADPFAPPSGLYTLKDPSEPHQFQPHDSYQPQLHGSGKQYHFAQVQAPEGVIGSVPIPQNEIPWDTKPQLQAPLPATSYSQSYRHALEDRAYIPPEVEDYDSLSGSESERSHPRARSYRRLGNYPRQRRPIGPSGSTSGGLDERPESKLEISASDNESRNDGDLCDEVLLRFTGHKLHEETTGSGGDDHTDDHVEIRDRVSSAFDLKSESNMRPVGSREVL